MDHPGGGRHEYACNECGKEFLSLDDYLGHCDRYHAKLIGTAMT